MLIGKKELWTGEVGSGNVYTPARATHDIFKMQKEDDASLEIKMSNSHLLVIRKTSQEGNKIFFEFTLFDKKGGQKYGMKMDNSDDSYAKALGLIVTEMEKISGGRKELSIKDLAKEVKQRNINYSTHADSDLYLPDTEEVRELLKNYAHPNNITTFRDQSTEEKGLMFEIPFAYDKSLYIEEIPSMLNNKVTDQEELQVKR